MKEKDFTKSKKSPNLKLKKHISRGQHPKKLIV